MLVWECFNLLVWSHSFTHCCVRLYSSQLFLSNKYLATTLANGKDEHVDLLSLGKKVFYYRIKEFEVWIDRKLIYNKYQMVVDN